MEPEPECARVWDGIPCAPRAETVKPVIDATGELKQMPSGQPDGEQRRAALVTGASDGIGWRLAVLLQAEGYALTLVSRTAEKLHQAAEQLAGSGAPVHAVAADISSEEDIVHAVRSHEERYGRLDILVNNAGLGIQSPLAESTAKKIDLQLAVNLRGTILLTRECIPLLAKAGLEHAKAWIINTSSVAGTTGMPLLATYSAAKHGVVGFTEAVNRELAETGVRACALCPGYVNTTLADYAKDTVPADQMIQTDDIAEALRFLLRLSPHCVVPEMRFLRLGLVP